MINFINFRNTMLLTALVAIVSTSSLFATDGYFSNGIGIKYRAMSGAGVGFHWGPLSGVNNPAASVFAGKGYEVNLSLFNPNREYTVTGNPSGFPGTFGLAPGTVESGSKMFVIPTIGANWMLDDNKSIGFNIYGNGGMNTNYDAPTFGTKPTGVNLTQLFVSPNFSIKVNENHALGFMPILAVQLFEAKGLAGFSGFSSAPTKLSNNDGDMALGLGLRIGYLGKLADFLSFGAVFQTKTLALSSFDEYSGLFAEQGNFDIPMNWTAGLGLHLGNLDLAFDVKQIFYSKINSVGNPLLPNLQPASLGKDNGPGFGWEDITVFKAGASYAINDGLTARAGYSFGKQPVQESEVLFNILAPGVIEQHISAGLSKSMGEGKSLDFFITRALSNSVIGANPLEAPNRQTIELKMDQWEVGVGFTF